jgi:hypothetical protein
MPRKFSNVPPLGIGNERQVINALANGFTFITAQAQDPIQPLATTATTAQIIAKINEIIARLQGT